MDYLNLEQIQESCPSVFTKKPSKHLSHIYKHIPTTRIIDILEEKKLGGNSSLTNWYTYWL